jgi:flagellar secretion chaperone FliS
MSGKKTSQYQAYTVATHTVAKTRQVVMLYDGTIRFLRQAKEAVAEKRIEDRFNLLLRASEVISGLRSSLDFDNGGEIAHVLHNFYTSIDTRILSVNFATEDGEAICDAVIDRNLAAEGSGGEATPPADGTEGGIALSA